MSKGMSGIHSRAMLKDEWLTPPEIVKALGDFDLDPCSPIKPPFFIAPKTFNVLDNGLNQDWHGRVFMNPPYGSETGKWLKKLSEHNQGTALIFARTETKMFFDHVWSKATALLFIKKRLSFYHVSGEKASANGGAPSVLIAYGHEDAEKLKNCGLQGKYIRLPENYL